MDTEEISKKGRGIWLVGSMLETITGSKLPSNRQVLARFFYAHKSGHHTIQESAKMAAHETMHFWAKARIPVRQDYNIINKIKNLYSDWQSLQRNASRNTPAQKQRETKFTDMLDDLFDVAHADALQMIKIDEDREFLIAQREKGRRGCLGSIDMKLAKQEERRQQREQIVENRKRKEKLRLEVEATKNIVEDSSDESEAICDEERDASFAGPSIRKIPKLSSSRPSNIITPELSAALDRTKTSDRNATYVLAATMQSLGQDPQKFVLNKESIRLARRQHRENIATDIRASFSPDVPLTVHWDGKILPALTSKETVDRLAVLVSGEGVMKLLGVPMLPNGTGEAQASATFETLQNWNLTNRVNFMSFDTTASNTGLKSGACFLLQQKLNRELISLACRHHIHELIIGKVFDTVMGPSNGPNIKLFQRFASAWETIDKSDYKSAMNDANAVTELEPVKISMLEFIRQQQSTFQPRDDYKELLQLCSLFLGAEVEDVHINAPGAYHRARWMAKLIYCLKIYIFRSQFKLTQHELSGLHSINVFIVRIYIKAWYTCPSPSSAPRNDLQLLKDLVEYKKVNSVIAQAALKSFAGQLWYLSEWLVGMALFDPIVSVDTKLTIVDAMKSSRARAAEIQNQSTWAARRIQVDASVISSKQLPDFVSVNSYKLLAAMHTSLDFLTVPPSQWESNPSYIATKARIDNLKVVNDAAERGVALIQSFNAVISNQEEQKQFLLQVVEQHRKVFPKPKKEFMHF